MKMLPTDILQSGRILFVSLILFFSSSQSDAVPPLEKRVVGGLSAEGAQAWPWQVSLSWKFVLGDFQRIIHMCGGALVGSKWVLTAGHCFRTHNKSDEWVARLGEFNLFEKDGTEVVIGIKRTISHPKFDTDAGYDIALAELEREVDSSLFKSVGKRVASFIHAVGLPKTAEENYEKANNCFITGWGETRSDASRRTLNEVGGTIWETKSCKNIWGSRVNLNRQVCFGNGTYGPCLGDSGGPLVCFPPQHDPAASQAAASRAGASRFSPRATATDSIKGPAKGPLSEAVIVGVTSFGTQTCDKDGWPGVFTNVAYHSEWIKQYVKS